MNKKIIIIGLVLLLAIAGLYGYNRFFGPDVEKGSKEITVEIVIEKEGIDAIKETFTFKTDTETVYDLLVEKSDKLSPKFLDSDYGKMLIGIMGYEVDANSEYLRFDIGTEMSMTGVSDTPVKNGETYRLSSSRSNEGEDITLIALLSASLTAGKMVMSFVPNVEIVTFLFIIYTMLFGFKRTLATSFIFSTTEILIYGFGTWLLGYYIIWPMLILITAVIGKKIKSEYGFAILAGLFGLTFGLFFALFESVFYGIGYAIPYWIRGIPFDIVHGVSNFILMLFLYKPILRTVGNIKEKMHFI